MESVFSRAYSYRERKNKNNLENYLIEIFSFCLLKDLKFLEDFLSLIDIEFNNGLKINTQSSFEEGRPDIIIENESTFIIIECKIDAPERPNQLCDYANILNQQTNSDKKLIYLTKFSQYKDIEEELSIYKNIKWLDVFNIIKEDANNDITIELKQFLLEKKIAMEKNFTTQDMLALDTVSGTISKMDEIIESIKSYFEQKLGKLSKPSSRSTWLVNSAYFNNYKIGNTMAIDLGFMWWWNDGKIYLTVRIWISSSDALFEEKKEYFSKELVDWEKEECDKEFIIGNYLNINEVVAVEDDQLEVMVEFMKENINTISQLKKKTGKYFK